MAAALRPGRIAADASMLLPLKPSCVLTATAADK
jgi:hypothetical protein